MTTGSNALQIRRTRLAAFVVILLTLAADQASKYWVLNHTSLPEGDRISVLPVFDFVLTWNMGISYGLFQQHEALGRWLLISLTALATALLAVWLWRSRDRLIACLALALIIGGALGNLVDRIVFGGVVDFLYLHYGSFSWYVFNLADCAIVAGVGALLYESLRLRPQ
ncbi:signal peptidase II [Pleomorphomonas sp. NRK KF1]|uniref:signal peptidase II n=1 Tax=Pleomorphomonas sp. NRK KF1 TaxID=2943000 RepID=UPI0020435CF1|nr:signal peptidase II [Pleomorphomonas sp. NRK KF1]MCM5553077.1 signal peptidase II [Pleomorphomonas sp. NRK KF1]